MIIFSFTSSLAPYSFHKAFLSYTIWWYDLRECQIALVQLLEHQASPDPKDDQPQF